MTPYDPFGDRDYKIKYFQHSANQFMSRRAARLDIDSASVEEAGQQHVTNEEIEEQKNGVGPNLAMINRSDAFNMDNRVVSRRPPL